MTLLTVMDVFYPEFGVWFLWLPSCPLQEGVVKVFWKLGKMEEEKQCQLALTLDLYVLVICRYDDIVLLIHTRRLSV